MCSHATTQFNLILYLKRDKSWKDTWMSLISIMFLNIDIYVLKCFFLTLWLNIILTPNYKDVAAKKIFKTISTNIFLEILTLSLKIH